MEHGAHNMEQFHVTHNMEQGTKFHEKLRQKMDEYVHFVYKITKKLPKEEVYGVTSQLRRAALSVVLNYIEGYARMRSKVYKVFLENSYASLQESKYLIEFSFKEGFLNKMDFEKAIKLADEIGAMLWSTIKHITHNI